MQIVFQDPLASLDPRMTIGEIVAEPLRVHRPELDSAGRRARSRGDARTRVGLSPDMINRYPHEFSGGQCQRIGIARAMVLRPKLLICDEPVSALDVSIQAQIVNLLKELKRDFGMTILFVSHNLAVVRRLCERVLVLYLGRTMELARPPTLYSRAAASLYPRPAGGGADSRSRPAAGAARYLPRWRAAVAACRRRPAACSAPAARMRHRSAQREVPVFKHIEADRWIACLRWHELPAEAGFGAVPSRGEPQG